MKYIVTNLALYLGRAGTAIGMTPSPAVYGRLRGPVVDRRPTGSDDAEDGAWQELDRRGKRT